MINIFYFVLLFILELVYFRTADKLNIIDKPNQRSSHTTITLRGGGIIFYIAALLFFIVSGFQYPWFILGLTLISIVSFIDDNRPLSSKLRLIIHLTAMLLMFYQWQLFTYPWYFGIIALIFCTGIINAYNFMDGINGLTGSYTLVTAFTLLYINHYNEFINSQLIIILILSAVVFLFFNFRKKAKCFAGDVGAISAAFILLFMLGLLILKTKNLNYIVFLAVYGVDAVLTIMHRLLLKENIFEAHRKHLYQLLANELKIPHICVASIYILIQVLINIGFITVGNYSFTYLAIVIIILSTTYIFIKKKYFHLHLESIK